MFLLRCYRFQITEVTFVMRDPFRNIPLTYARASEVSQVMYALSANIHYSSSNINHLQVDVKAKISLCGHFLIRYFGIRLLSCWNLDIVQHSSLIVIITVILWESKLMFLYNYFNYCFYRFQITESRICHACTILSETFTYNMRKRPLRIMYFHFSGT